MSLTQILCLLLIIVSSSVLVENRSYNNGLIFYNLENQNTYLPPTISVSRGRGLSKFKYSSRGSIWSTFGKPCDCAGPLCGCCVGIKVKQFNFDQKMCANVSYVSPKEEIQLEVFLNDTSTAKYGVAARNPSPLCVPIMMGVPMSMCMQMSNIGIQGDNLNMCMDFLVRLASTELFEMHFQCMKMGLQGVGWVGADGQPVIPANEGKIKDKSSNESVEYYDGIEDEKENEVISKEKEKENEILKEEFEENQAEDDKNKAEEEMDYNDKTEKILDIVKEKEKEEAYLKDNNKEKLNIEGNDDEEEEYLKEGSNEREKLHTEANDKDQLDVKTDETKIESHETMKDTTALEEIVNQSQEKGTAEQKDKFFIITEVIKPEGIKPEIIKDTTFSEIYSDHLQETSEKQNFENYGNMMATIPPKNTPEENNDSSYGMQTIATTVENEKGIVTDSHDVSEMKTAFETETEKENSMENNEKLQSENEVSSEFEKFEMLTNNKEDETTEFTKNVNDLNNSLEIFNMPLKTTTELYIAANLKPTMSTLIVTTSETNNINNIDNVLTTATIMTTTTTMKTKTTDKEEDNDVATNLFENTNNNNDNSNDSDNSLENDSDYGNEESDEAVEEEDNEERIENMKTTTVANLNIINFNDDKNSEENTNNEEKDNEQTTIKEISNAASSEESNSNDMDNHSEDEDDEEVEDNEDSDEEKEEYEENEIETTTIRGINSNNNLEKALMPSSLNKINTINDTTNDTLTSSTNNLHLTTTDTTIDVASSNSFSLNSSDSMTLASDSSNNKVNTTDNISQISATVAPLPLARKLFTHHRYHRQQH